MKKSPGRPKTSNTTHLMIRIDPELLQAVDDVLVPAFNKAHPGAGLTRSDVVRMLLLQATEQIK